ncbi:MAG TPA: dienelactone hydrolase family protein, partial [Ktedonobacterales bacterium]
RMTGRMVDFEAAGTRAPGYLATPDADTGPGVIVLHAFWGLTEPFRQVCDRLAEAGYSALAPDLYRGETATTVERAQALGDALDAQEERWRGDIVGAARFLQQYTAPHLEGQGKLALVGFSLGGAYALDMSVTLADRVAAVVVFYDAWAGPDFRRAQAAYLCHFAEEDTFLPPEKIAALEQALKAAGRDATFYTYPGTKHWFFEANRPDAYSPAAAALAWERTLGFLNTHISQT